jgi:cell division inhibitor SepF
MSSLHKFKAYFGMVPTDDYDSYDGSVDGYADDYNGAPESTRKREPAFVGSAARSRSGGHDAAGYESAAYEPVLDSPRARTRLEPLGSRRVAGQSGQPVTRGALAMDERIDPPAPTRRSEPFAAEGHPLAKITTLNPTTYNEARTIGERYREGIPVIMNLTEMSDADAKRLVDFAAGLAFAMRGSIDKVTNKVFLLSPSNVDVSAEVKRHIVENGFYNHS